MDLLHTIENNVAQPIACLIFPCPGQPLDCTPESNPHFVPVIFAFQGPSELKVVVDDSREGWRDALKVLLEAYFYGHKAPVLDVSQLR